MNSGPSCLCIPAQLPFMAALVRWILSKYGHDQVELAKVTILLPSRRAVRSLRETFLECTEGKPLLLPRMIAIGDVAGEDMSAELTRYAALETIPSPISGRRRQLLLARLVTDFEKERFGFTAGYPVEQAIELARELADFIDEVAREQARFDKLDALVPEELAMHWQQTLNFLNIVSRFWPKVLAEENALDPVDYRNRVLAMVVERWKARPPDTPIIAAGSTGSQPATAALLAAVARLPNGTVVLPGLDVDMPQDEWEQVEHTHPQYGLKQLLEKMGCERKQVALLAQAKSPLRVDGLRTLFQPPLATAGWAKSEFSPEGLAGMSLLVADTLHDEARMIAVALRQTLEMPGKTAALVTPDRTLARIVAAQMQRFGVTLDDSAGKPLKDTPAAAFVRLVAAMIAAQGAPVALLSVLRHPLCAAGMPPAECRRLSRELELETLRGVRHSQGIEALRRSIRKGTHAGLHALLAALEKETRASMQWFAEGNPLAPDRLLAEYIRLAEWLASTGSEPGEARLWAGESGEQLAGCLGEWMEHVSLLPPRRPQEYAGLFDTLISEETYRPRYGAHPRLHILSPIEARLLRFDTVILGGMNEGVWPALPKADPWMSRPMRQRFGLPLPERAIGQSAHDMYLLCASAPQLILTRARKVEGAPSIPSRWLVRLQTLLKGIDKEALARMSDSTRFEQAKAMLDAPLPLPALPPPEPLPPLEARPRQMRVTAIDQWLRDPYWIYAAYILKLSALRPLDKEPDAADFGTLVHRALELFLREWPHALPEAPVLALLEKGREAFSLFLDRPSVASLWWPRFEAMAEWLVEQEKQRRALSEYVLPELKGTWTFEVDGRSFALTTRIDRLELRKDGLVIADYKTGSVPTAADIAEGLANQLLLEGLVVRHGELSQPVPPLPVTALEYWKLSGNAEGCKITTVDEPEAMEQCEERLQELIRRYDHPQQAYAATFMPDDRYNDFAHLTRRAEWDSE